MIIPEMAIETMRLAFMRRMRRSSDAAETSYSSARRRGGDSVLISVHIPKTGGTSFRKFVLAPAFGDRLRLDYGDKPLAASEYERISHAVNHVPPEDLPDRCDCVHGQGDPRGQQGGLRNIRGCPGSSTIVWKWTEMIAKRRKYDLLRRHLAGLADDECALTFGQIEAIIGDPLPRSSGTPWWWANHRRPQARAWVDAGWRTAGVDLRRKMVRFERASAGTAAVAHLYPEGTSAEMVILCALTNQLDGEVARTLRDDMVETVREIAGELPADDSMALRLGLFERLLKGETA